MKIAYITMQFPVPSETFASLDVESLRQQGQDVCVFGMRCKHSQYTKLMFERGHSNMRVEHFSLSSLFCFLFFLLSHPLISISLLWWVLSSNMKRPKHLVKSLVLFPSAVSIFDSIFKNKPDIVHLFWGHYPSMVGFLVNKYMPNTVLSMFLGAHDLVSAYPGSVKLSENVDVIFTHSKSNLPMIARMGIDSSKVNVIVRGTKLDFQIESTPKNFKDLNNIKFLTAARLIEEKGVDDVIRIFENVLKEYPDATLDIAGDGPFRRELNELVVFLNIQHNVNFLGHIGQIELISRMSKSHFFLLMSRYLSERLPNVAKEAMHQKCVVITTNTDGIDELIKNESDGFIVSKNDCEAASNYIKKCISDPVELESIGNKAHFKIITDFDVNVSMKHYLMLWQKELEGSCL